MRKTRESRQSSASQLGWMPTLMYYTPVLSDPTFSIKKPKANLKVVAAELKKSPSVGLTSTSPSFGRWIAAAVCQLAFLFGLHAASDQVSPRVWKKSDARKPTQRLFD